MKSVFQVLACLILLGGLPRPQADAGWIIEEVVRSKGGAGQDRQVIIMGANRIKSTFLDRAGQPTVGSILDLEAQTMTHVDYEGKRVASGTVRDFAEGMRGVVGQAAGGQMAEAMKQMQEAMKDMSPEQRKMMEQMMGQSMPGGGSGGTAPPAEACREPQVEVRPTGNTARIAGFPATRYDIFEDGKFAEELWVSKSLAAWREIDPAKMERFSREMARVLESLPGCGRDRARQAGPTANDPAWKLASEGYPVRMVDRRQGDGTVTEVVKAESRDVPATEFQPPAGFTRQSFKEMFSGPR